MVRQYCSNRTIYTIYMCIIIVQSSHLESTVAEKEFLIYAAGE